MSGKEYVDRVRREQGLLEKIISYVPGYRGYKEKELRRETDRLVRMEAVNNLKAAKKAIKRKSAKPSIAINLSSDDIWRFDTLTTRLDRVTQRLDRAVAGYAGLFDATRIKEDKLDSVIEHDLSLIESARTLKLEVEAAAKMEPGNEDWRTAIDRLISLADELDGSLDTRTEVLRGITVKS